MKELESHLNTGLNSSHRIELSISKQQQIESMLMGSITPKRGHRVWQINCQTKEIQEAEYKNDTVPFSDKQDKPVQKLVTLQGHVYIPALNKRTALAKFNKNPNQDAYYDHKPLLELIKF